MVNNKRMQFMRKEMYSTMLLGLQVTHNGILSCSRVLTLCHTVIKPKTSCLYLSSSQLTAMCPLKVSGLKPSQSEHMLLCMNKMFSVCSPLTLQKLPWEILFNLYLEWMLSDFGYLILNDVKFIPLNLLNQIFHFCFFSVS